MTDWSGQDYAEVSGLQRAMVNEAVAQLEFSEVERVLGSPRCAQVRARLRG